MTEPIGVLGELSPERRFEMLCDTLHPGEYFPGMFEKLLKGELVLVVGTPSVWLDDKGNIQSIESYMGK